MAIATGSRRAETEELFDAGLAHLPPELRWREWMGRVEAVIFASPEPVGREVLAGIVGRACSIDLLIDDISEELRDRPCELVSVAGGWQHRSRDSFADAIISGVAQTIGEAGRLIGERSVKGVAAEWRSIPFR